MRGKVYLVQLYCGFARITPAYAGKSASTNADRFSVQDHPRVCGEKAETERTQRGVPGSPPRMRGKVVIFWIVKGGWRITPAYAGKSLVVYGKLLIVQDHPRVCGEKTKKIP